MVSTKKSFGFSKKVVYEGIEKILFEGSEPCTLIQHFKDDLSLNGKVLNVPGKGVLNNRISEKLMTKLSQIGIQTHYIRRVNMREQLVNALEMFPFIVIVRNGASGDFCSRFGLEKGITFDQPILEYYFRSYNSDKPMVNADHIMAFSWASSQDVEDVNSIALRANDFLQGYFSALNINLLSVKLEFGKYFKNESLSDYQILVADEITSDVCSLVDSSNELEFDNFENSEEDHTDKFMKIYQGFAKRLGIIGLGAVT